MRKKYRPIALLLTMTLVFSGCGNFACDNKTESADTEFEQEEKLEIPQDLEREEVQLSKHTNLFSPGTEDLSFTEDEAVIYVNDCVVVVAEDGITRGEVEAIATDYGAEIAGMAIAVDMYQILFPDHYSYEELDAIAQDMEQNPAVELAFVDELMDVGSDTDFDDPWDNDSKSMVSWDDTPSGNNWGVEAIHAPEAWDYLDQMKSVVNIAVIEAGFPELGDEHDLPESINRNYASLRMILWANPFGADKKGREEHGAHVAGTICAIGGNNYGITGVYQNDDASLHVGIADKNTSVSNYVGLIQDLVEDKKVKVINVSQHSFGSVFMHEATKKDGKQRKEILEKANVATSILKKLNKKGYEYLIVVAAGNENEQDGGVYARYNHFLSAITDETVEKNIIVVGSFGLLENAKKEIADNVEDIGNGYYIAPSSNGGDRVDILAPGEQIYSIISSNECDFKSGTSMAAPHVAGVAAMLFSCNDKLTGEEVKNILIQTADYGYDLEGFDFGGVDLSGDGKGDPGLLRADRAVQYALGIGDTYDEPPASDDDSAPNSSPELDPSPEAPDNPNPVSEQDPPQVSTDPGFFKYLYYNYGELCTIFPDMAFYDGKYGEWYGVAEFKANYETCGVTATYYEYAAGDPDAYMMDLYFSDYSNGNAHLNLYNGIETGMTLSEIMAMESGVNDINFDDETLEFYADVYLENQILMRLLFDNGSPNAVCTGAKFSIYE